MFDVPSYLYAPHLGNKLIREAREEGKGLYRDIPGSHVELPSTSGDLVVGLITIDMVIGLSARKFVVGLATRDIVGSNLSTI